MSRNWLTDLPAQILRHNGAACVSAGLVATLWGAISQSMTSAVVVFVTWISALTFYLLTGDAASEQAVAAPSAPAEPVLPAPATDPNEKRWINCAYCEGRGSVVTYYDQWRTENSTCGICNGKGGKHMIGPPPPLCRRCGGSGKLQSWTRVRSRRRSHTRISTEPCDVCRGTGHLSKQTA